MASSLALRLSRSWEERPQRKAFVRQTLLLLLSVTLSPSPATGQAPPRGPVASILFSAAAPGPLRLAQAGERKDSVRDIRPTHWKEGALVGGLLGAVGGALVGRVVCGMSDEFNKNCTGSTVVGAVGGAVLLAIPGALIGGQFRKGGAGNKSPPD